MRAEDREAAEWVRGHGGLGAVEARWEKMTTVSALVGEALWGAPGRVPDDLDEDGLRAELLSRIMPADYEWPRYEDGTPVRVGDEFERSGEVKRAMAVHFTASSCYLFEDGPGQYYVAPGALVKRPASKVIGADGTEIRAGDDVWSTAGEFDGKRTVKSVHADSDDPPYVLFEEHCKPWSCLCCLLTHQAPVIAADGKPLREGETVWYTPKNLGYPIECRVEKVDGDGSCELIDVVIPTNRPTVNPGKLTHERPAPPDS